MKKDKTQPVKTKKKHLLPDEILYFFYDLFRKPN